MRRNTLDTARQYCCAGVEGFRSWERLAQTDESQWTEWSHGVNLIPAAPSTSYTESLNSSNCTVHVLCMGRR